MCFAHVFVHAGFTVHVYHLGSLARRRCRPLVVDTLGARGPPEGEHPWQARVPPGQPPTTGPPSRDRRPPVHRRVAQPGRLLARLQLSSGWHDLFAGEPAAPGALETRAREAASVGHWGSSPGLSFAYIHLNRLIIKYDLDVIFLAGPGHGAPGVWRPPISKAPTRKCIRIRVRTRRGCTPSLRNFPSRAALAATARRRRQGPFVGGELGYSVSHAFGAAFDNPDLLVAVMVGDGEAETGALATSWHSNKFLNPIRDGAVLPILHLNGYKINNPTLLARISHDKLASLFKGYGWTPHFVEGDDPARMHQQMAATLEDCVLEIRRLQQRRAAAARPPARAGP